MSELDNAAKSYRESRRFAAIDKMYLIEQVVLAAREGMNHSEIRERARINYDVIKRWIERYDKEF